MQAASNVSASIQVCPKCAQVKAKTQDKMRMRSRWIVELNADHSMACLCDVGIDYLSELESTLSEKLDNLKDECGLTGALKPEIYAFLNALPRGAALRHELGQRMSYLDRVRDEIAKRRKDPLPTTPPLEDEEERQAEKERQARLDARLGKPQSLRDWLLSMN